MRKAIFVLAIVAILVSLAVYLASPVSANTPDASISDAENMVPAEPVVEYLDTPASTPYRGAYQGQEGTTGSRLPKADF